MEIKDIVKKINKWYEEEDSADSFLYVFVSNKDGKLNVDYDYTGNTKNLAKSLAQIALFDLVLEQDSLEQMLTRLSSLKEMVETELKKRKK